MSCAARPGRARRPGGEDISKRVQDIQLSASATSEAISRVSEIVVRVNDYQTTIASAVEE